MSPVLLVAFLMIAISSCTKDETTNDGNVSLKAKATLMNTASKSGETAKNLSNVAITSFKINIREIEFEIDDDDDTMEELYSEIELDGPFELDLSNGSTAIDITSVDLPNNVYDEIEFDLHKSTDSQSDLYGKSIEIKGEINGVPFVFWHDTEEEFEVDYNNNSVDVVVDGTSVVTTVNFDLSIIFGAASNIDFSTATDADQDGVIEINPNDDDGNNDLADFIKNLLEESSDLLDD